MKITPEIDAIQVVAVESYIEKVWGYAAQYNISKLKWVVSGGESAQESTRNSVFDLEKYICREDTVLYHMSVSPLIDDEIISDSLRVCKKYGNAIAGSQSIFNVCRLKENYYSDEYYSKKDLVTLNMPAILPELGFINNLHDLSIVTTHGFQKTAAESIMQGINIYFGKQIIHS